MPYFWPLHLILCPQMWPCSPIQSLLDSAFSEIKSLFSEVNVEECGELWEVVGGERLRQPRVGHPGPRQHAPRGSILSVKRPWRD